MKFADPVEIMRLRSLERQLEVAKEALYNIAQDVESPLVIQKIINDVYWLVEQ